MVEAWELSKKLCCLGIQLRYFEKHFHLSQSSKVQINCIYNNVEHPERCVYTKVKDNEMKF